MGVVGTPHESVLADHVAGAHRRLVVLDGGVQLANVRLRFAMDEMPTLRLAPTDADRTWDLGTDTPAASVSASSIDFLRSFGGRRTYAEIRSLDWTGEYDGMAERMVLPFFRAPAEPLPGG